MKEVIFLRYTYNTLFELFCQAFICVQKNPLYVRFKQKVKEGEPSLKIEHAEDFYYFYTTSIAPLYIFVKSIFVDNFNSLKK